MKHLSLSRESFEAWCCEVKLNSYKYEFSSRTYFISGEFYAKADKVEIQKIKELHGEKWHHYYKYAEEVLPYIEKDLNHKHSKINYKPKSKETENFINELKS